MGRTSRHSRVAAILAATLIVNALAGAAQADRAPVGLDGLRDLVQVHRDAHGVPHIFAGNDHDAAFMLGYVQARERFFEMDVLRRTYGGTLAELVGEEALAGDVQVRTLGLRRGAEASYELLSEAGREWLAAFAAGVNAHLDDEAAGPAAEYEALELDRDAIPAWTPVDSLLILRGVVFSRSFDLSDLENTLAILRFHEASSEVGFDAAELFFDDVYRSAPFDAAPAPAEFPDPESAPVISAGLDTLRPAAPPAYLGSATLRLILAYETAVAEIPLLRQALERDASAPDHASLASGAITRSGDPIVAQTSLLGVDAPASFFELSLHVREDARRGVEPLDVSGVVLPGVPGILAGCNPSMCWGSSAGRLDVTDVYQESLVLDPSTGLPTAALVDGEGEPLVRIAQTFRFNRIGDEVKNNLETAEIGDLEGGVTLVVSRRQGPIVSLDLSERDHAAGLSLRSTAWSAGREIDAFLIWARARDMEGFIDGLERCDSGSLSWSYADVEGHVALFSSGKVPLREDLQELGGADGGLAPFFVRDGTHAYRHEWIRSDESLEPGALPFAEMPHFVDPAAGWLLSAGNDPVGATLDNDALDQGRAGGGLYYLGRDFARGFQVGQLNRLLEGAVAGGRLALDDFRALEADHQLPDAAVFVPHLTSAWLRAGRDDAPQLLRELALDAGVSEAVGRLAEWDFTAPTGVAESGAAKEGLGASREAIEASVAATLYAVWRARLVHNVIDDTLADLGLGDVRPVGAQALAALRHLLADPPGAGASGVDFFAADGVADPADARDAVLLASMREALDLLAGDPFAAAFDHSRDQNDYRWGLLHRSSGVPRAGGFGAVAGGFWDVRAERFEDFTATRGPARGFLARLAPAKLEAWQLVSGAPESGAPKEESGAKQSDPYRPIRIEPADVIADSVESESFLPKGSVESLVIFANPSTLPPSGTSTITIVARNAEGTPARPGGRIRLIADQGTIEEEVFTDENGEATATFTAGERPGTAMVTAIRGTGDTANVRLEIRERRPELFVEATPSQVSLGQSSTITVIVRDEDLRPLGAGLRVRLTANLGTVDSEVFTDENGEATATFTAGDVPGSATVVAFVGNSELYSVRIDVEEPRPSIFLFANPSIIPVTGSSAITIIARDRHGNPLGRGERIRLVADLGTLEPSVVFTNGRGEAETTFVAGLRPGEATITAFAESGDPSSVDVSIRDAPDAVILMVDRAIVPAGVDSTIDVRAFVANAQGLPVAGALVVFALSASTPGVFDPGAVVTTNSLGVAEARLTVSGTGLVPGESFIIGATVLSEGRDLSAAVAILVD